MEHLSKQESEESTGRYLSYYDNDTSWCSTGTPPCSWTNRAISTKALYLMELANLQLAELEAYDRLLDEALERSYRDLGERRLRSRRDIMRELRDIRIDMAGFNDELSNITKFFGDWHLARIYEKISSRFHLSEWHRTIDGKLKTLDELYQLLHHDQNNRTMFWLEMTIIILFVIDLVVLVFSLKGH